MDYHQDLHNGIAASNRPYELRSRHALCSRGARVRSLQEFLYIKYYHSNAKIRCIINEYVRQSAVARYSELPFHNVQRTWSDGIYGMATSSVVSTIQKENGLRSTGIVDLYTAQLLRKKGWKDPLVKNQKSKIFDKKSKTVKTEDTDINAYIEDLEEKLKKARELKRLQRELFD